MNQIKVLVITRYQMLGESLKSLLELDDNIYLINRCNDDENCLEYIDRMKPDVVVYCIVKEITSLLYRVIKHSSKIILLSNLIDHISIKKSMVLGADGYIILNSEFSILQKAIYAVVNQDENLQKSLPCIFNNSKWLNKNKLYSKREYQILELISIGIDNKEIAELFSISEVTVRIHISNLLKKTNCSCRNQLIIYGIKHSNVISNSIF